ncbi:MAG: Gfo/Idh/MocA family oxidoreductase [Planctomycetaceae bacterium]
MSRQTRREFLEKSMFAAAAAAAAGPAASAAFGQEKQSSSPNERLRVAVVGARARGRGQAHLNAYMGRRDCEVVAVVDVDETAGQKDGVEKVEKATQKKPAFYTDLRKALEDKNIDAVSIATPNHQHALQAIWSIQAGKDVYCEKPVSHNVSEGRRIVQAARKHDKIVQTGTQSRSFGGVQEAIKFMQDGNLGKVAIARALCYKPRASIGPRGTYDVPAGVDYDLWTGPAPMLPLTRKQFHYDWHWQWPYGNGDLGNQGIHQMDIARWGLGVNDIGKSVVSYGGRVGYEDAGDTANTQVSIHEFDDDKRLVFEVRGLKTGKLRDITIGVIFYCSDGVLVVDNNVGGAAFDHDGNVVKKFSQDGDHFGNFVEAVKMRDRNHLFADIEQGHLSSALCHLGNISYRLGETTNAKGVEEKLQGDKEALATFERFAGHLGDNGIDLQASNLHFGKTLMIDGKAETFTGGDVDQATAMLTREYREPFVVPEEKNV